MKRLILLSNPANERRLLESIAQAESGQIIIKELDLDTPMAPRKPPKKDFSQESYTKIIFLFGAYITGLCQVWNKYPEKIISDNVHGQRVD